MSQSQPLGDPKGMRPSVRRTDFGYSDPIGVHPLDDGREALVTWLPATHTHVHVLVWVCDLADGPTDDPMAVWNVARFNAAGVSEKLLKEMES
jgi:hypothetical protein